MRLRHQPGGQPGHARAGPLALPLPACPLLRKMKRSRVKKETVLQSQVRTVLAKLCTTKHA
jgi:hypothetical protein